MSETVHKMFSEIAPKYDLANDVLSFGVHRLWRKRAVTLSGAQAGDAVIDCATGTGDLAIDFKRAVGDQGKVVGTDFNADMLRTAPEKARQHGVDIDFQVADAMKLPFQPRTFNIASISFGIRNVDDPLACLKELARVTKSGGRVVVLEFGQPTGVFGMAFRVYAKHVMPLIGAVLTGNRAAYEYLPETASKFPANEKFLALMERSNAFTTFTGTPLMSGLAYIYVGVVR